MTRNLAVTHPACPLTEVALAMENAHIGSMLVCDETGILGIVTERDLLHALSHKLPGHTPVSSMMSRPVVTIQENVDYREAYPLLAKHGVRHLVVVDASRAPIGMVSETDLKRCIDIGLINHLRKVRGAMTSRIITLPVTASVLDAATLMEKHHISSIIVEQAHVPVGIVTERDMVRLFRQEFGFDGTALDKVMSSPVVTVSIDSPLQAAVDLMHTRHLRHVVVVENDGRIAGMLTQHDIIKRLEVEYIEQFIAERKQIENSLRETQEKLAHTVNVSAAAIYVVRLDPVEGKPPFVSFLSQNITRIAGYGQEDWGKPGFWESRLHPDDRERVLANQANLFTAGELQHEYRFHHQNGSWVWIHDRLTLVRDADGKPHEIVGSWLDITERRQMEERLRELNETLEKRVQEEVAANREKDHLLIQQSRLAAMGEMVHNIAHQWRQPISALGMILQNIEDTFNFNELSKDYLHGAVADGKRLIQQMSATIDDFRHFFRPDKEKTVFLLDEALHEALSLISGTFRNHNIQVMVEEESGIEALGYPREFSQVLLNVLNNAKEALQSRQRENAAIRVKLKAGKEEAVLTIQDNAGGIPDEILPKIFDPYFTTKDAGSGIGLYMSRKILENMDGRIEARNTSEGAELIIRLPRHHGGGD